MEESTKIISKILGKKIDFKIISMEDWLARHSDKIHAKPWATSYPGLEAGILPLFSSFVFFFFSPLWLLTYRR
jgi:hypothetical protein